ncbi:SNF2-related protein [Streptomyces sp. BRA346]|uniref:SNF2-related protein n=1 Tax=Streptomyces sp. BRA346 TaxID=2878199 RepID=UPI004064B879
MELGSSTALGGPATSSQVAHLDAAEWHEALKEAVGAETYAEELAEDAVNRARMGRLSLRDLRLLLIVTGDHPGWLPARQAALHVLAEQPDQVRKILLMQTQVEVWPPPAHEEQTCRAPQGGMLHEVTARIGPSGQQVAGPVRRAMTLKVARQQAEFALLAQVAGVAETPAGVVPAARAERLALPGVSSEVFEARLMARIAAGGGPGEGLEEEILRRAGAGRLRHRDMQRLLFDVDGPAWQRVREVALERAALMPPTAATLLHWRAEQIGDGACLSYEEVPAAGEDPHTATARLEIGEPVVGQPRSAMSRKTARHYAAVSLLASVCGLTEPRVTVPDKAPEAVRIAMPPSGVDPLKYLNKYTQLELISKPSATIQNHGKGITCSYTCRHRASGQEVRTSATGPSVQEARRAAATLLLRKLHTLDTSPTGPATGSPRPPAPAPPSSPGPAAAPHHPPPVPSAPADRPLVDVAVEALTPSCAMAFVPARGERPAAMLIYRVDGGSLLGPQPSPLATVREELVLDTPTGPRATQAEGWLLPLGEAVPVLMTAARERTPHLSVQAWEHAARIALQLVASRLVYPALTEDHRAVWRTGPLPDPAREAMEQLSAAMPGHAHNVVHHGRMKSAQETIEEFCDALADALVRTPAAAVFGPAPYTHRHAELLTAHQVRALRPWLDSIEDRVDGGPPPGLILDIAAPTEDQARAGHLTARLLLAPDAREQSPQTATVPAADVWSSTAQLPGHERRHLQPRVRRALRRAAGVYAELAPLAAQPAPTGLTLLSAAINTLLDRDTEEALAAQGVTVRWPQQLRTALSSRTVIGTPATERETAPRFSLHDLLDFRWQLVLGDQVLSEAEMDALAEAARPLVRIRGQWVLLDGPTAYRAGHRQLPPVSGSDALGAALTGTITVDGTEVACESVHALNHVITTLRAGTTDPQVPVPPSLNAQLRGYQRQALTWLARTTSIGFGACLADDMGLGKTITLIALRLHQGDTAGPTLVVCPASLLGNWQREIETFAPGTPVRRYHGASRSLTTLAPGEFVLTTYGTMRLDAASLAEAGPWGIVVADEAQHVKNPHSQTAHALRTLPADTRIALTGTPVENSVTDLWALLDWTTPGLLGDLKTFRSRYAPTADDSRHPAAAEHLARLVRPFLLRRRKSDPGIAPELPRKTETDRPVALTPEQAALYEAVVREAMAQIRSSRGIARRGLVVKLLTALKQICNHPAHYLKEPGEPRTAGRSGKLELLDELTSAITAEGDAALVFTQYVEMAHLLSRHLAARGILSQTLHGGTPVSRRQKMVDRFQAGEVPVFLLSLKAAGTGLNLTRAGHVVHYDRWWNPAVEAQATDRAYRIGQTRPVQVHRLISEGTIEDRIAHLLKAKAELADAVLGTGEAALTELTDTELADLVSLKAVL